jgi:hypothetical protein
VTQVLDLQREMRKAMAEERAELEEDDEEVAADDTPAWATMVMTMLQQLAPFVMQKVTAKPPAPPAPPPAEAGAAAAVPRPGKARTAAPSAPAVPSAPDATAVEDAQVKAILAGLTPVEKKKVLALMKRLPNAMVEEIQGRLLMLPLELAVGELREMVAHVPDGPPGSNGAPEPPAGAGT